MANFNRGGRSSGGRSFGKRDFGGSRNMGRPQLHNAICDNCGKECQVPFKPTGEKPVYCRDCFAKMNADSPRPERQSFGNNRPQGVTKEDVAALNEKLDKILSLLETASQK